MTLLITAVTPDGIVMAADSALTMERNGRTSVLTSFPKIIEVRRLGMGISVAGSALIGRHGTYISQWVQDFEADVSNAKTISEFSHEIAEALTNTATDDQHHLIFTAALTKLRDSPNESLLLPEVYEIARHNDLTGEYTAEQLVSVEFAKASLQWQQNSHNPYPVNLFALGMSPQYCEWIVRRAHQELKGIIGGDVLHQDLVSVADYLHFLIRMTGDLLRLSRETPIVAEPILVLTLFARDYNMALRRY